MIKINGEFHYTDGELEEIAREREIQAVEQVLTKIYCDDLLKQEKAMEYLENYIKGEEE